MTETTSSPNVGARRGKCGQRLRILMCFSGGMGHFLPLLPVASALADAGHDVAFTGQHSTLGAVRERSFKAFDSGGTLIVQPAAHASFQPFEAERLRDRLRKNFAGSMARERLAGVTAVARDWRPDAIVCDEMDFGAMLAAEGLGIPSISVMVVASGRLATPEWLGEPLEQIRSDHGLESDPQMHMLTRHLAISPFPAALRMADLDVSRNTIRFDPFALASRKSGIRKTSRPAIYATFGTEFNLLAKELFGQVIHGLSQLDADVIATVGRDVDPRDFGRQPINVRLEPFVDQSSVLPSCDLVVSHGGSGSLLGGLAHALPMLLIPLGADQPFNAERGESLGFARRLDPADASSGKVRESANMLLRQEGFRKSAKAIRTEIRGQQRPEHVVFQIENVVFRSVS